MLKLYGIVCVLSAYVTLCNANSAGVGVPCSAAAGGPAWAKLGHPMRGNLQAFQDRIDAAQGDAAKALIKEERLTEMHRLEADNYLMYWVLPPIHDSRYTVRTGEGLASDDPIVYTPGQWMNIYVTALNEGEKFTGLIIYAANAAGKPVGEWQVDPDSAFRYSEAEICVTHRNADLKGYRNVFRFKAPGGATGTIKFHAMVKVGLAFPVLNGNFYYPNTQPLTLTEGGWKTQTWFEGAPGQSCSEVCASNQNMQCDLPTLQSIGNSKANFYAMAQKFSPKCVEPIMSGCGPSAPSVGTEGCFFHDSSCGVFVEPPVVVRKDPCEGLAPITNSRNMQPNECVTWIYQRQNNGIGASVYNNMYANGEKVKVCCGASSSFFQNQDAFNDRITIEGKCAPPGGYTPFPTPSPPPPKVKGAITCEAVDSDIRDGGRICACSGGNTLPPNPAGSTSPPTTGAPTTRAPTTRAPTGLGETWAPTTAYPTAYPWFPPAGGDPNGGTRSSPNIVLVSAVVLLTSMSQIGGRIPKFLSVLSLALSVNAHNWMSSPSRANNGFNAYQTAPCPPKGSRVHFQVQAGQKFPMEFATGHSTPARGGTYLTVLRAEDESEMIKHTRAVLDDYLASVPSTEPAYMAEFKSHHVGSTAGSTTTTNVAAQLAALFGVGAQSANIRDFGPNWGNKPPMGAPIYPKTAAATAGDLRVKYTNAKYPWIISVHKFKLHEDKSEEADLVMMEIPVGSPPGQYVVQYSWNGYYDCTDVNVISDLSTDFYGEQATQVSFDKFDHCLWNPFYTGYNVMGECHEIRKGDSADACFSQCESMNADQNGNGACYGVQVVPYSLPNEVVLTGKSGLFQSGTKTYPAECNTLTGVASDSLLCFPLMRGESVVGSNYDISEDPYDSIFYGTCYIKGGAWNFAQAPPGGAVVTPTNKFKFGGQECITCEAMTNNQNADMTKRVPFWDVTFGECEHCDRTVG